VLAALSWRTIVLVFAASAAVNVGSRAHPYKLGAVVHSDGFAVTVVSVQHRALAGRSDVTVTIRATNQAKFQGIPFVDGTLGAVDASGFTYSSLSRSCGTIPGDVTVLNPVRPGATVTVHTCWKVANFDLKSLVMYYAPYDGSRETYFALH